MHDAYWTTGPSYDTSTGPISVQGNNNFVTCEYYKRKMFSVLYSSYMFRSVVIVYYLY